MILRKSAAGRIRIRFVHEGIERVHVHRRRVQELWRFRMRRRCCGSKSSPNHSIISSMACPPTSLAMAPWGGVGVGWARRITWAHASQSRVSEPWRLHSAWALPCPRPRDNEGVILHALLSTEQSSRRARTRMDCCSGVSCWVGMGCSGTVSGSSGALFSVVLVITPSRRMAVRTMVRFPLDQAGAAMYKRLRQVHVQGMQTPGRSLACRVDQSIACQVDVSIA